MNVIEFIQDHDVRMKEIEALGALGKSPLLGSKLTELLDGYHKGFTAYTNGKIGKKAYLAFLGRLIRLTKPRKTRSYKNTPFDKLPEKEKQRMAEDWASHNA